MSETFRLKVYQDITYYTFFLETIKYEEMKAERVGKLSNDYIFYHEEAGSDEVCDMMKIDLEWHLI